MAARKLQQEVDKCFKKVAEGVAEFEAIYEKIEQSNNISQKEKLEDNLKREIKKLQRLRDQIKTWAASNDIKDKAPLLEHRRLIETQMEKFKAVEKAMKTKAYSKEGLASSAKLDPQEQAKAEASDFLSSMVDELEQQIETLEAESESIQATMKKGKNQSAKAERIAEIERIIERHKWHQSKLELIRRSLENGGVDTDQVTDLEELIRYYVSDGMNDDYIEDDEMYDDLNLDEEEGVYGMPQDGDKGSSQDAQSQAEEPTPEPEIIKPPSAKPKAVAEVSASGRRSSAQSKSPLPALATLHTPLATISNGNSSGPVMKPASVPARPAEGLKYASAAAAAAASDKIGISPLPPPPGAQPVAIASPAQAKTSVSNSPATTSAHPVAAKEPEIKQPTVPSATTSETPAPSAKAMPTPSKAEKRAAKNQAAAEAAEAAKAAQTNGAANGVKPVVEEEEEESIYHLPASLQDLVESFETSRKRPPSYTSATTQRMLQASQAMCPDIMDTDVPRTYRPDVRISSSGTGFPSEPLPLFEDPRLYQRIDPDTLFYVFYYKQGTPQQYLAAKALKDQSWRFHKQYQTWFQRHEEPKNITEEFEQGTYRFFDYESTWMNRRKADFKFAYKFLEDDV
ncbi:General negative regulator of transcription subunit 3 [Colletotrichum siamense]|uniref:General negative regulator of transcription subunit n=1 Tax=Colletotrichum siamense TaxID=690259 RepID=A0A9P5EKM5_COLSI|nr:General negative regulator of transcription subunit 3 [Colletotrichum siamense]KAF4851433.1 General negative regulator of transcription subunit 3 [Colletotrichum siamense]